VIVSRILAVFQLYFAPMSCLRWHESSAHTFHRPNTVLELGPATSPPRMSACRAAAILFHLAMPRIDATPHPMMAAHEVDPMAAITRAHIDGLGVRWRCCGNIRLNGNARGRWLRWSFRLGRGGRRRRPDYWNRMNGFRQIGKLFRNGLPQRQ